MPQIVALRHLKPRKNDSAENSPFTFNSERPIFFFLQNSRADMPTEMRRKLGESNRFFTGR